MRQRNSRTTEECCDDMAEALRRASDIVSIDTAAGLIVSSFHIDRAARTNTRGEFRERFFVNITSHDGE